MTRRSPRSAIAAEARARALAAGLEGVSVRVTIAGPDRRQRREVVIDIDDERQPERQPEQQVDAAERTISLADYIPRVATNMSYGPPCIGAHMV